MMDIMNNTLYNPNYIPNNPNYIPNNYVSKVSIIINKFYKTMTDKLNVAMGS